MSDHEEAARLFAAARSGSTPALGQMLSDAEAYLLLIARRELDADLRSKCGASDLVQETLLEAHRDFSQFHGQTREELQAWLRRLLLNNLANVRRGYRDSAKRRVGLERHVAGGRSSWHALGEIRSNGPSPSELAIWNEQQQTLEAALHRLPADYQRILLLRYAEGLSFEAIAQLFERSANAVEKLWLRAVERLREELETAS